MKAKISLIGLVFLLIASFGVGCGVPQEEYEKAKNDLAAAQSELATAQKQVESLKGKLQAAQDQIKTLQSDYEEVTGKLKAAQDQIKTLQKDYDKASSELKAVQSQIESLQGDYDQVKEELKAAQDQIETLQQKMKRAKAQAEIVGGIFIPAMTGELDQMTDAEVARWFLGWLDNIEAVEDPVMEKKLQALIESEFGDKEMIDFFIYLLESIPKTLEQ